MVRRSHSHAHASSHGHSARPAQVQVLPGGEFGALDSSSPPGEEAVEYVQKERPSKVRKVRNRSFNQGTAPDSAEAAALLTTFKSSDGLDSQDGGFGSSLMASFSAVLEPLQQMRDNIKKVASEYGERAHDFAKATFNSGSIAKVMAWHNFILCALWACICVVFLAFLASQLNFAGFGRLREVQVLKVQMLVAFMVLAVFGTLASLSAELSPSAMSKTALRYLVEGYLLYVVLYVAPSTLSTHIDAAEAEEERKRKAKELARSQTPAPVPSVGAGAGAGGHTPPLLLAALKQFEENQEEQQIKPEPIKTPLPILFLFLLCLLRPALAAFGALGASGPFSWAGTPGPEGLSMMRKLSFAANVSLVLLGLGVARVSNERVAKYVVWYPSASLLIKALPLLGAGQDFALALLPGSDGIDFGDAQRFGGLLYLFEVAVMLLVVAYKLAPGRTLLEQLWEEEPAADAQHTHWLRRVLDPRSALCRSGEPMSSEALKGRQKAIRDQLLFTRQKAVAERLAERLGHAMPNSGNVNVADAVAIPPESGSPLGQSQPDMQTVTVS